MGKKENKAGRIKDYLKGIIFLGGGVLLIIVGFACISILPVAIILWVIGCPAVVTGLGLIIHNKKNNTIVTSDSSSSSSSSSSSPSPDSPKSYRRPEKPESTVSHSQVVRAVRHLSYGQVRVSDAYVSEMGPNEFNIELTLTNATGEMDMLETHANAVLDQAKRAAEDLGIAANISAHF